MTLTSTYAAPQGVGHISALAAKLMLALIGIIILIAVAVPAHAKPIETGTRQVLHADNEQYASYLLVSTHNGGVLSYGNCLADLSVELPPFGTAMIPNFGDLLCGDRIGLSEVTVPPDADVSTYIVSRNPAGVYTSFEVGALETAIVADPPVQVAPIENHNGRFTYIALVNQGARHTNILVHVYDGKNKFLGSENIDAAPGVTLYPLQTDVIVGRIELLQSLGGVGCPGCPTNEPVYGFVTVNTPDGGAPRVLYFH